MMKSQNRHESDVKEIRLQFKKLIQGNSLPVNLNYTSHASNTMRSKSYNKLGTKLNVGKLNSIIKIDAQKQTAYVEPRVTFDELVKESLKHGFIPCVAPEFKSITVGGAIMGAAIESSSHFYGQFNDTCLAYEILIGDGSVVRATSTTNPDLFYGISGSYGSLGTLLGIELKLVPAQNWVKLRYHKFENLYDAVNCISLLQKDINPPHFLEGIIFSKNYAVVIEGWCISDNESADVPETLELHNPSSQWFYEHVKNNASEGWEKLQIYDYLFRYDRGAFWIGSYAQYTSLLMRYFFEGRLRLKSLVRKLFGKLNPKDFVPPKDPGFFFRSTLGRFLSSQRLYSWLHTHSEGWVEKLFFIHDFYIPSDNASSFIDKMMHDVQITPIWLCPVKATSNPEIFSPHYRTDNTLLINVGIYGISPQSETVPQLTRDAEALTYEMNGRKMLYSHAYYNNRDFWMIYPKEIYDNLRQKYHAEGVWINIENKILNNGENNV